MPMQKYTAWTLDMVLLNGDRYFVILKKLKKWEYSDPLRSVVKDH